MNLDPALSLPLSWLIAGLMAIAGWHKLVNPGQFAVALKGYSLFPDIVLGRTSRGLGIAIGVLELGIAVALVWPVLAPAGPVAAAMLFGGYGLVMSAAILRGRAGIDCGCHFGARNDPLGWLQVWRNGALVVAALVVALPHSRVPNWLDSVSGALAGGVLVIIIYSARQVLSNAARIHLLKGDF